MKHFFVISLLLICAIFSTAQQPVLVLPIGHTRSVSGACFSPDGRYVLSTSTDLTAKLWEVSSGMLLHTMGGHDAMEIFAYSFSPDGKTFLTTNYSSVNIWNTATGLRIHSLQLEDEMITGAAYSPNGRYMIAKGIQEIGIWDIENNTAFHSIKTTNTFKKAYFNKDGKYLVAIEDIGAAAVYETATGNLVTRYDAASSPATAKGFNLTGECIITSTEDGSIKVWDVKTGKPIVSQKIFKYEINQIEMSHDGKSFAAKMRLGDTAKIFDTRTGQLLYSVRGRKEIFDICFSDDGKYLLIACEDGTAKEFDAKTGTALLTIDKQTEWVWRAEFSRNGRYIITASGKSAKIWDAATGKLVNNFQSHTDITDHFSISNDKKYLLTVTRENNARIWDIASGKLLQTLTGHTQSVGSAFFSTDNKWVVTSSRDNTVKVWEIATGKLIHTIPVKELKGVLGLYMARFSDDDKYIITGGNGIVKVWETASWKEVFSNNEHGFNSYVRFLKEENRFLFSSFAPKVGDLKTGKVIYTLDAMALQQDPVVVGKTGKFIATICPDSTVKIWDAPTGKLVYTFQWYQRSIENIAFSPDEKYLAGSLNDMLVKVWDLSTGKIVRTLKGHTNSIWTVNFSNDSRYIATGSFDNTARIWDVATGRSLFELKGHTSAVNLVEFGPDDEYIFTSSYDSKCKKWNAKTGQEICTSVAIDSTDYFVQVPAGYYMSTSAAVKQLHYLTGDHKIISFEQLDVKYNRPDKVLQAIGNNDTALIRSYQKAYEKRIKKLGIDTTAFRDGYSVPEADIVNRDLIEFEQKNRVLQLHIKGNDSTYKLDRFNVWVNETPLFGQRGISIRRKNKNDLDTTIRIILSQGKNRIETSVTNINGTESYRMPLTIDYTPSVKQKEMLHFIGIGIDRFTDNKYNLQYSAKDIRDLSVKFKEKFGNDIIIDTLFNENVTLSNVKALKQKLLQTTENDKVIVAYSGHGMLSKDYDYYLSTYSVNFEKPEQNGLPYDELESLLDSIPARKKLMLIDACHSGEVDKEDLVTLNANSDSLIKGFKPVAYKQEGHLGLKNSFELMQSLFVNVGKSTGATIISAAAGTQFALERNDLKNGVFTYSILEAMNKYPTLTISELKKIVGERVEELTKGLQKPTSRNETIAVDWSVW